MRVHGLKKFTLTSFVARDPGIGPTFYYSTFQDQYVCGTSGMIAELSAHPQHMNVLKHLVYV
jgi:hypothetical protein